MNPVDIIKSALSQLPQTNNPFDAYGQMLQNTNVPAPIRNAGKIVYNTPVIGFKDINNRLTERVPVTQAAMDMATAIGGVQPKMGQETIDAISTLINNRARNIPINQEDFDVLLKTAKEQSGLSKRALAKLHGYPEKLIQMLSDKINSMPIKKIKLQ